MTDEIKCTCPPGRPLSMPHLAGCPMKAPDDVEPGADVIAFRNGLTGRPVLVPHDVASAADRAFAAWERKLEGQSWEQVALSGGWPSAAACAAEVRKYLEEGRAAIATFKRAEVSQLWGDRLELLWSSVLEEAKNGKVPSVMAALAIAKQAMVLAGLDQPNAEQEGVRTVVVPSEEYIATLKKASGES